MNLEILSHPLYARAHHKDGGGYTNLWGPAQEFRIVEGLKWVVQHSLRSKDEPIPPVVRTDPQDLASTPERLRITWVGHSSTLIQTPDLNLLTDPQFSERASPFRFVGPDRKPPLPINLEDLPQIDAVLISHDHYDHLDKDTIRRLAERFAPLFVVPLGIGDIIKEWGASRVIELDWWQYVEVDGARFHCTPARHFSGRGLTNRYGTLWASWYVEIPSADLRLYYAGDTGYAEHFRLIREQIGAPDVALVPIGAYLPRWFMEPVHVDPAEAVQAFVDLDATHFIPVHWGTFDLADEWITDPIAETEQHMAERNLSERLHRLPIGGSWSLAEVAESQSQAARQE